MAVLTLLAALLVYTFGAVLAVGPFELPGIDASVHYPWEVFTRAALNAGERPYWNPYLFSGLPHIADVQTIVFYPPAMLLRWLPPEAFLSWQAVAHMWIGGAGMLFLARVAGLSWWAGATAAVAITLGGTNAARLYNGHLLVINGVAWLPWALALSIRAVRHGALAPSPALVLVMVLQFLSGYAQGSLYITLVVCLYFLFSVAWPDRDAACANRWRPLGQLIGLGLVALGLSAFQLLPTLGLAAEAARSRGIPFDEASAGAWTLAKVATLLWPFSGIEMQPAIRFIPDRIAYAGWALTCLSPFALLLYSWPRLRPSGDTAARTSADSGGERRCQPQQHRRVPGIGSHRGRLAVFCVLLVGLAVAFTLEALPLYRLHHAAFPGLREPARILVVATLGLAVLGGFGLDALVEYARARRWRTLALPGAIATAAACSAAFVALTRWQSPDVFPIHGWPWIPIVATTGLIAVAIAARAGARRAALAVGLLVCIIDVTVYSQGGARVVVIENDVTMRRWAGPSTGGRAMSLCENRVDAQGLLLARVPAITGPVGVNLGDYIDWLNLLDATSGPADVIGERSIRRDLLNSANVSTIISCQPISATFLELVAEPHPVFVYSNTLAWPRAIWTCEAEEMDRATVLSRLIHGRYDDAGSLRPVISVRWAAGLDAGQLADLEERYRLSGAVEGDGVTRQYLLHDASPANLLGLLEDPAVADTGGIDHQTGAITTEPPPGDGAGPREVLVTATRCPDSGTVVVTLQDRSDGVVRVEGNAPRPGLVFLSEPHYSERHAFVDGERVIPRKANLAFVAVPVPAGRHVVELRYVPMLLDRGAAISIATLGAWGGVLTLGRMWRGRSTLAA